MLSRRIQQQVRLLVAFIIRPLANLGVTPNMLTLVGLLLSGLTALVIAQGYLVAGGLLVLFAGIFDMFDGAVARVRQAATTFGAFFDSTLDRYSESIILFGLLWYVLQRPDLHEQLWPFGHEQLWMIVLVFVAVVGSLMVSYTKARAEGLGLECKTGLLARPERVVILAIGLIAGIEIWALVLLAVFSQVTALERMFYVWRITRQQERGRPAPQLAPAPTALASDQEHSARRDRDRERRARFLGRGRGRAGEAQEASARPVPSHVPPLSGGIQQKE
nr:CDP-alcohol phosphatidyltransferase family protein [Thermogemmatispora carboxidivorans]